MVLLHCHLVYAIVYEKSESVLIFDPLYVTNFIFLEAYRIFSLSSVFWDFTMINLVWICFHELCWALDDTFQCGNPVPSILGNFPFSLLSFGNTDYSEVVPLDCSSDFLFFSPLFSNYLSFSMRKLTLIGRSGYSRSFLKSSSDDISIKKRNIC